MHLTRHDAAQHRALGRLEAHEIQPGTGHDRGGRDQQGLTLAHGQADQKPRADVGVGQALDLDIRGDAAALDQRIDPGQTALGAFRQTDCVAGP